MTAPNAVLARKEYESASLPPRTGHAWRYTDPRLFVPAEQVSPNGFRRILPSPLPEGIHIVRFGDAQGEDARVIAEYLGTAVGMHDGKMEAFDLSFWHDAVLIRISAGADPDAPVHLVTDPGDAAFTSVRLLIVAGEGSMTTILDDYRGGPAGETGQASLLRSTVEIIAAPSSCVRYTAIQELGDRTVFHLKQRARAGTESSIMTSIFSFGGSVARADLGTILEGRGASSRAFGVIAGGGNQHFDHHTVHLHRAPGTRSDFDFRSVLSGRARSVYTGSIIIGKDAPGCEAYQINRNLMLSDEVRADSIPELEIMNDDVRCSHGAATGPVEPSQVFYLMARGLPEDEAKRLIAAGFAEQLFTRVSPEIRDRARALMEARLGAP